MPQSSPTTREKQINLKMSSFLYVVRNEMFSSSKDRLYVSMKVTLVLYLLGCVVYNDVTIAIFTECVLC